MSMNAFHIPFRASKLTQVSQEHGAAEIVIAASPRILSYERVGVSINDCLKTSQTLQIPSC